MVVKQVIFHDAPGCPRASLCAERRHWEPKKGEPKTAMLDDYIEQDDRPASLSLVDAILPELLAERRPVDAEQQGGCGSVAAALLKHGPQEGRLNEFKELLLKR